MCLDGIMMNRWILGSPKQFSDNSNSSFFGSRLNVVRGINYIEGTGRAEFVPLNPESVSVCFGEILTCRAMVNNYLGTLCMVDNYFSPMFMV